MRRQHGKDHLCSHNRRNRLQQTSSKLNYRQLVDARMDRFSVALETNPNLPVKRGHSNMTEVSPATQISIVVQRTYHESTGTH